MQDDWIRTRREVTTAFDDFVCISAAKAERVIIHHVLQHPEAPERIDLELTLKVVITSTNRVEVSGVNPLHRPRADILAFVR